MSAAPGFDDLADSARRLSATTLHEFFARDPERAKTLSLDWNDWRVDGSKERIDEPTLAALLGAAEAANLPEHYMAERIKVAGIHQEIGCLE